MNFDLEYEIQCDQVITVQAFNLMFPSVVVNCIENRIENRHIENQIENRTEIENQTTEENIKLKAVIA